MCSFYNFKPYFEKLGIKYIESKADKSDLKNKTFDDLEKGEDKKFVDDFLNPLNEQFLSEVRSQRSKLAEQDENAPVLRGETFYSSEAMEIGLNDGMRTLSEVIAEAVSMGAKYSETKNLKSAIYNII